MSASDIGLETRLASVVGAKTADALAESLDLETVGDLLRHYPRRYHVQGELTPIRDLEEGEYATVDVEIVSVSNRRMQQRKGTIQELVVTDGFDRLTLVFFNQHFRVGKEFAAGQHGRFDGKVVGRRRRSTGSRSPAALQLQHPRIATAADEAGHIAVYPASAALNTDRIRKTVGTVLDVLGPVADPLPEEVRASRGLPDLRESFRLIHRPESEQDWQRAQRRFRFEEAYVLQVVLALRRAAARGLEATPRTARPGGLVEAFDARLPFTLTDGQQEVGEVLTAELALGHPMQRLLQGEVGSGKTVVALRAMLTVVDAGGQAALLAPTEVLAQQHLRSITELLGPLAERGMLGGADLGTRVALLTGSMGTAARRQALLDAVSGDAGIVIGTHALLEERVQFLDLGLVVVDEQHRFGVEQRAALATRASEGDHRPPHVLVMTATPIPRTVAMTVFGDLETSTLAELPQGRASIATHVVPTDDPVLMGRVMPGSGRRSPPDARPTSSAPESARPAGPTGTAQRRRRTTRRPANRRWPSSTWPPS